MAVKKLRVQCGAGCNVEYKPALSLGCQVFIMLKELEVHEVDCVYRNITCPFLHCNDKDVSFIGLGKDLEANHENLKKIGKSMSKDFVPMLDQRQVWIPQGFAFHNHSFFTEVHCDAAKSRHFWVYFHGTPEEAVH
jgi:hypothetical protein